MRERLGLAAIALALSLAAARAVADDGAGGPPTVPKAGALNEIVLRLADGYPADGTHRYYWPKGGDWAGTTRDLVYGGRKVCEGDPKGRAYCCGLTFEVFFRAWEAWCAERGEPFRIGDLDADGVVRLRKLWYGSDRSVGEKNVRRTLQHALESTGLGRAVPPEKARPGDFVQLWRESGSGHSVIFLGWKKDAKGRITAIRYWSTQTATDGIGINEEKTVAGGGAVLIEETFIARVGR